MKVSMCDICANTFELCDLYQYRHKVSCSVCFEKAQEAAKIERTEYIVRSRHVTDKFKGLPMGESVIGKLNRIVLKKDIEVASKYSELREL